NKDTDPAANKDTDPAANKDTDPAAKKDAEAVDKKQDADPANKKKGDVAVEAPSIINSSLPAIANYMLLNKASGGTRKIAPISPLSSRYVGFSERQLLPLFWHWPTLKSRIQRMISEDGWFQNPTTVPALADAQDWLTQVAPGRIITTFVSDVGRLPAGQHNKGFRRSTMVMDFEGLREHLGRLRAETFSPKEWTEKGYIHKGAIRTNSNLLQLLAFKVKELQSVRYRRVSDNKLPNPLSTAIGGTNNFLTEARNVFKTTEDVENLLAADPSQVSVLSLDLGTSCVVGASVSLPPGQTPATLRRPLDKERDKKKRRTRRAKRKPGSRKRRRERKKACSLAKQPTAPRYFDLVVKRKAVSQPTHTSEGDLDNFYNNTNFWKHQWDSEARSLNYLVVGVNEYYSSKRCPICHDFVCATSNWRSLYCKTCKTFRQRDVMASNNMNAAVRSHLADQQRPLYLQPKRQNGTYAWTGVVAGIGDEVVGGFSTLAPAAGTAVQGPSETTTRKRLVQEAQDSLSTPSGTSFEPVVALTHLDKKSRTA
ncbi:hypothetical protein BGX24_005552, partial [Mortierella sp. AD032]